jgi:hypothetical protein
VVMERQAIAPEWERPLWEACRKAGLNDVQTEIVLCRVEGQDWQDVAQSLKITRKALAAHRDKIEDRLRPVLEAAERAAGRFMRDLIFAVLDRRTYDERPPGVCGVVPDRSSDRFQGAPIVSADDTRIGQRLGAALRLGEQATRPVRVPEPA